MTSPNRTRPSWISGSEPVRGAVEPRLWTRPLRPLTPDTSYGFDVVRFADETLRRPLRPWQQWLVIHAGELLPDGRPRFRRVVAVVARQNGKTEVFVVLAAYWMFIEAAPQLLQVSAKLAYARKTWDKTVRLVERSPALARDRPRRWTRTSNGEVEAWNRLGSSYVIAAANGDAGRSLTVHRLGLDELRQHHNYEAWDAATNAMTAVDDAQAWALTNAGTDRSIVLNDLADSAVEGGDPSLGWFEWSAPDDAATDDLAALAMANPEVGGTVRADELLAEARAAMRAGGEKLAGFRTEKMCIRVRTLNPAIDPGAWATSRFDGNLAGVRDRVALCLDVAPDAQHVTLMAAAVLPDGRTGLDVVAAWAGVGATNRAAGELKTHVRRVRPRVLGWFPNGPAAELAADLAARPGWPPAGVTVAEVRGDTAASCMALASQVAAGRIAQPDDALLNAHVAAAEKLQRGDTWVFARQGRGHVDAAYAAAGAVQLARTLPPSLGRPRVVMVTG